MIRVLVCVFFVWGYGAYALGGGPVALIATGILALAVNWKWKQVKAEERRQRVIDDEDLRLQVRERRTKP